MGKLVAAILAAVVVLLGLPMLLVAGTVAAVDAAADPTCPAWTTSTAPVAGQAGVWRAPFAGGYVVTSPYGMRRHPVLGVWKLHDGIDLAARPSPGRVVAAAAGTVTQAGWLGGFGTTVTVAHAGGISTRYSHLAALAESAVPGRAVLAGQALGIEGSTGYSTGPHLHFSVLIDGATVDPAVFMRAQGSPLDGTADGAAAIVDAAHATGTPGLGFDLPAPGTPRQASLHNPPAPIPAHVQVLYEAAGRAYRLPWTLLAGIGMAETAHGRATGVSSAGARGHMQFMPATFATMGVDGDGDGHAVIDNPADSIFSAANYLTHSGVHDGPTGVRAALFAYNRATWYVNDVLFYAHAYGGGPVSGSGADPCAPVPAGTALAMVTYNIHYGRDPGAVASEIASVTARAPGGVVCLQEATVAHRVRLPHGWHLIQPRVPGPNGGRIPSATPLLVDTTRWSVTGTDTVELTDYTRVGEPGAGPVTASRRDLVLASLTGADGTWTVGCTHFTASKQLPARSGLWRTQAATVAATLTRLPRPVLVGGDFNATPESSWMRPLTRVAVVSTRTGPTLGRGRIDYVLGVGATPVSAVLLPRLRSDHHPVLTVWTATPHLGT